VDRWTVEVGNPFPKDNPRTLIGTSVYVTAYCFSARLFPLAVAIATNAWQPIGKFAGCNPPGTPPGCPYVGHTTIAACPEGTVVTGGGFKLSGYGTVENHLEQLPTTLGYNA